MNDAFDGISGGVAGYNKSTGEFSYAKTVLVTKAQEQIDGWNKLIDAATQGIDLEDLAWSKLEVVKQMLKQQKRMKLTMLTIRRGRKLAINILKLKLLI